MLVSEVVYETGISVVSANDTMADHTAEHVLGALLGKLRAIQELDATMKQGGWCFDEFDIRTLYGKTVRLVGLGTIGRKLLDHLSAFDVTVRIYDPYVDEANLENVAFAELTDLDTALSVNIISIHAARTPETVGMIDADRLAQIPDDALFINTARAEIVVEEVLLAELRNARFDGVFDVYHEESLPEDHELRSLDNVLLTPHVGGSQIRASLAKTVIEEIERFKRGKSPDHEIPRGQWETMTR